MVTSDPIADMLTRIRNAIAVHQSQVNLPHSKIKEQVALLLVDNGFIESVKTEEVAGFRRLALTLNQPGENSKISGIRRISSPGRRLYSKVSDIPRCLNGRGIVVVSTSRGLMTDNQARSQQIGGELLCEVY